MGTKFQTIKTLQTTIQNLKKEGKRIVFAKRGFSLKFTKPLYICMINMLNSCYGCYEDIIMFSKITSSKKRKEEW